MHKAILGAIAAAFIAVLWTGTASRAEEKGEWRGKAVLVKTGSTVAPVAGRDGHNVMLFEYDGVVFNDMGGSFLDKARYQAVYLGDSDGMVNGGYKTFTLDKDSKVFAKFEGTEAASPVFKGNWHFIGGTGKVAGITGNGTWVLTYISPTTAWDVLEGDYKIP